MKTTRIKIEGMKCASCVAHVIKALRNLPGVRQVDVTLDQPAVVEHDHVDEMSLLRAISGAGTYRGEVV
jgi:copper chaperone CopZ